MADEQTNFPPPDMASLWAQSKQEVTDTQKLQNRLNAVSIQIPHTEFHRKSLPDSAIDLELTSKNLKSFCPSLQEADIDKVQEIFVQDWATSTAVSDEALTSDEETTPRAKPTRDYFNQNPGVDGANSLHSSRQSTIPIGRSVSSQGSALSTLSFDDEGWEPTTLLDLTDAVRGAMKRLSIPIHDMRTVSAILSKMLADENNPDRMADLTLLAYTSFDKLLAGIIKEGNNMDKSFLLDKIIAQATSLQHQWHQRFKAEYFTIDELRMESMKRSGSLHDVVLNPGDREDGQMWIVNNKTNSSHDLEGDLSFQVGDWWLNMVCAYRDGIIANPMETLTKGAYGITALALLSGNEKDGPALNMLEYTREGSRKEMHSILMMSNRGRPIRLMRGFQLNSKYAPKAGIRYDGLHVIKSYGQRLIDHFTNTYTCRIVLEKCTGEPSMEKLLQIPLPSQMDDWDLYNRIIGHDIRQREGDERFSNWKHWQDALEKERLKASSQRDIQERLKEYTLSPSKDGSTQIS